MIETFYNTDQPEKGKSECYVLVLTPRPTSNGRVYSFMEEHGKWDQTIGRFVYEIVHIVTEGRMTREEASAMYKSVKRDLWKRGFVHSFSKNPVPKEPKAHELPEIEAATA